MVGRRKGVGIWLWVALNWPIGLLGMAFLGLLRLCGYGIFHLEPVNPCKVQMSTISCFLQTKPIPLKKPLFKYLPPSRPLSLPSSHQWHRLSIVCGFPRLDLGLNSTRSTTVTSLETTHKPKTNQIKFPLPLPLVFSLGTTRQLPISCS